MRDCAKRSPKDTIIGEIENFFDATGSNQSQAFGSRPYKLNLNGRRMRKLGEYEVATGGIHYPGAGNLSRSLIAPTVFGCNAAYPDGDWPTRARKHFAATLLRMATALDSFDDVR